MRQPMAGRIIRFLAETGMRQEEVCGLEWPQVSIQRREIRLTKTKTSSPRVVPLSDAAIGTLVGTPRHITSPYVFWHHDGKRHSTFANSFALIARRAEVPFRCHDLRHAFASRFLQATGDIPALQAILGHRSIQMTMRYAHMITSHLHRAMADFGTKTGTKPGTTERYRRHSGRRPSRKCLKARALLAEREGFEPSVPQGHNGFRDRPDRPLRHLSRVAAPYRSADGCPQQPPVGSRRYVRFR